MDQILSDNTLLSPLLDVVFKMLLTRHRDGRLLLDLSNMVLRPSQLSRGDEYEKLRTTYAINFLNFDHFECQNPDQFVQTFRLREDRTGVLLSERFELHFIELLNFLRLHMKNPQGFGDEHLDHWLQFLLNPSDKSMKRVVRSDPIIGEAMDPLKEISSDEQARQLARMREVGERDYRSGINSARKEGLEEGLAKGLAEGREKGLAEGRAEGEAQAKIQLLKSLLDSPATASLSNETLAAVVQVPLEVVIEMRVQLNK